MKFREPLLELLRQPGYRPATVLELSRLLGLNKKLRPQLAHEVRTLLAKGDLDLVQGDRVAAANFNRSQNYSPQSSTSAQPSFTSQSSGPQTSAPPPKASDSSSKPAREREKKPARSVDKADKYAPPGRPIFAPGGKATKGLPMANETKHDTIPAFVPPNSKAGKAARASGKTVKAAKASKAAATEWKNQTAAEVGAAYAKEKAAAAAKSGTYAAPKSSDNFTATKSAKSVKPGKSAKSDAPNFPFGKSSPTERSSSSVRSDDRSSQPSRYAQDAVTGKINFRASGFAFVVPPRVTDGPAVESIQIFPEDTGLALHGDTVEVAVNPGRRNRRDGKGTELTGRVLQVLERGHDTIVGNLQKIRNQFYVKPDDPRLFHEVTVTDPSLTKLKPVPTVGDKVVVRLAEWTQRKQLIHGVIIERLGKTFEPRAELAGIYHKFKLDPTFPAAVESEVADLPDTVQPQELAGRLDYRTIPTFTIDPDDAKDFDDALSIEYLDGGDVRIGIHIADVSTYVKPGTALDKEAQRRGNSTYLVGTVIPMLPEKLSNGLCSLVEAQDRLTKAVFLVFDPKGRPKSHTFANTVIRSRKRLTYKQAYALLFEKSLDKIRALPLPAKHQTGSTGRALNSLTDEELTELQTWIRQLWKIASKLRQDRMANGSLDLDMPETKVFVDAEGYADRLEKIEHDESHQLIEEFMLAANESVARLTKSNKLASIYRVHDEPDSEKLNELREYLVTQDIRTGDLSNREELVNLLHTLATHPQGYTLRTQLLRSLKKAAYRGSPDGHFGLAKKDYTHFTSPIRRYSDLAVHRVFDHYLIKKGDLPTPNGYKYAYSAAKMDALGEHLSLTEINSAEAERESVKIKLLEFFERELAKEKKTTFAAVITDVRPNGMFVELTESMTFGFISMNTLTDDVYTINNAGDALTGRRTKKVYQLAAKLEVCVEKVDRFKRLIDFRPSDIPSSAKPTPATARR